MPTQRARSGFTLVEILVVITIIGIVLSVAVLSLGVLGDNDELDTSARRFVALMEVAQDEALLQGREFGLEVFQEGYRFVELNPLTRQWTEIVGDDVLRSRQVPEIVELELYLEGQRIELGIDPAVIPDEDDDEAEQFEPHIFIFSSGDMTPFELHFRRIYDDELIMLGGDTLGNIEELEPRL